MESPEGTEYVNHYIEHRESYFWLRDLCPPPPAELTLRDFDTTPTLSPTPLIASFFTAASIECVQFRIGVSSAPVTTTLAAVCWKWSALKRPQNEHQEL